MDWAPPVCSFSKVFGHCDKNCVVRPKTVEEFMEIEREELKKKRDNAEFEQVRYKRRDGKKVNHNVGNKNGDKGANSSRVFYKPVEKDEEENVNERVSKDGIEMEKENIDVYEETSGSAKKMDMEEFIDCINDIKMDDICISGLHYTWIKSLLNPNTSILKKIDRAMGNEEFLENYQRAHVVFLPCGISYHSHAVLKCPQTIKAKSRSFRFANYIADKDGFMDVVKDKGRLMNLFDNVKKLKRELDEVQTKIDADPTNTYFREQGVDLFKEYTLALEDEEKLLLQKTKVDWLKEGDRNSAYFPKVLKSRSSRCRVEEICDENGVRYSEEENVNERVFKDGIVMEKENIDVYEETSGSAKKMAQNDITSSYADILNGTGLGKVCKQNDVKNLIVDANISICAILETRLKGNKVKKIGDKLFGIWNWYDNVIECSRGCIILIGWDTEKIQCMIVHASDQAVLCLFEIQSSKKRLFCTFIHAEISGRLRKNLWSDLSNYKSMINDKPWIIMGDQNVSLNLEDHSEGISYMTQDMEEFKDCINDIKMDDICSIGLHYTWIKNLFDNVKKLKKELDEVQTKIDADPTNTYFREQGVGLFKEYTLALEDEEKLLLQKTKVDWLKEGKLLGEFHATLITLVPKVSTPKKVSDFRPVACCNVVYKCISEVITNRIKNALESIVNKNQSAFILERQIPDNILLTQELLKGYACVKGPKRCSMKTDIQKACDTVNWKFLGKALRMFGGRGLRQEDPLSPYLFTIVMEVFNLILQQEILRNGRFKYHHCCKELEITHLCFADDLLSTIFCGSLDRITIDSILQIFPFKRGKLPVRYLGVPLVLKKIGVKDSKGLIDKVKARIQYLRNKSPSYAGRTQLIASVLSSIQNVANKKDSLWVKWISTVKLKGRSVWEVGKQNNDSWIWRSLLDLRIGARENIVYKIGNGKKASVWHDRWSDKPSLDSIMSRREISLLDPILSQIHVPNINADVEEKLLVKKALNQPYNHRAGHWVKEKVMGFVVTAKMVVMVVVVEVEKKRVFGNKFCMCGANGEGLGDENNGGKCGGVGGFHGGGRNGWYW
nr:hypothetical protein [Tanacetum cinerariifolium]